MSIELSCIEVETSPAPTHSVIWLHGLGADAEDFTGIVPVLALPDAPGIRFVFPRAPEIRLTCNGGASMRAWYDIISMDRTTRRIDEASLLAGRESIRRLIARENARGVPCRNIFLAGFSQGGAMAYATALTHPETLAGIVALSTYLPASDIVLREASEANRGLPILAAHGTADDVVAPEMGEHARDTLLALGYRVQWHAFPMQHSVAVGEIRAIAAWLRQQLNAAEPR